MAGIGSPSQTALQGAVVDAKTGAFTQATRKMMEIWQKQLQKGFDQNGNLISSISGSVAIVGHSGTIGAILQFLDATGVLQSAGMVAATADAQGAVVMPAGATSNQLGSAAVEDATAFDPAGAAAAAQGAAEIYADASAAATLASAEAFASNASNLNSGTVDVGLLPGISVTITTAALTGGGTQGSMTFTNGLLTAQVAAT